MVESIHNVPGLLGGIGWPEILVVLVIALLIFGRRLPEIARSMGRSLNEFKKGMQETKDQIEKPAEPDEKDKAGVK